MKRMVSTKKKKKKKKKKFYRATQYFFWLIKDVSSFSSFADKKTLVPTTSFFPKNVAIKMNLLLYRILNEQSDM